MFKANHGRRQDTQYALDESAEELQQAVERLQRAGTELGRAILGAGAEALDGASRALSELSAEVQPRPRPWWERLRQRLSRGVGSGRRV